MSEKVKKFVKKHAGVLWITNVGIVSVVIGSVTTISIGALFGILMYLYLGIWGMKNL